MSADHPNAADQPRYNDPVPQAAAGPEDLNSHIAARGGIHDTQSIGTSVIVTYNDGSTEVLPRDVFGTTATAAGGTGNALGRAQLAAQQAAQQASLAETIRQFNEQMGMDKARGDQQQRLAEALGQSTIAERSGRLGLDTELGRGNLDVSRGQLGLNQQTQAWKQYTDLANLASNPRNFVQTYFMNRGFTPPPDVARYGNTTMNASQIPSFSQYQAQRGQPLLGSQLAAPASPPPMGYGGQGNPTNPYAGTNFNYGGSPTVADKAMINGVETWAGGPYSGKPVASSPANAGDLVPYLQQGQQPRMMAKGGRVTMYVPHALVNLATGRTVAIAGERGKENADFDGAAIIDPYASNDGGPPLVDDSLPLMNDLPVLTTPGTTTPLGVNPPASQPQQPVQPTQQPTQQPATSSYSLTPDLIAQAQQLAAQANAANTGSVAPPPKSGMNGPVPTSPLFYPNENQQQAQAAAPATYAPPAPSPVPQPLPSLTDLVTPGTPGGPVSFGQPIPSTMPTYLSGEDFNASSPVTEAVRNLPFMKRLWAQARGDQSQGTNIPQRNDLPPDLPLVSSLAWSQLSPSEQESLLSFVSSLGVTPEDYLAMIRASSPSGSYAQSPIFGNNFAFSRQ